MGNHRMPQADIGNMVALTNMSGAIDIRFTVRVRVCRGRSGTVGGQRRLWRSVSAVSNGSMDAMAAFCSIIPQIRRLCKKVYILDLGVLVVLRLIQPCLSCVNNLSVAYVH
jgi:hypothetical protein